MQLMKKLSLHTQICMLWTVRIALVGSEQDPHSNFLGRGVGQRFSHLTCVSTSPLGLGWSDFSIPLSACRNWSPDSLLFIL